MLLLGVLGILMFLFDGVCGVKQALDFAASTLSMAALFEALRLLLLLILFLRLGWRRGDSISLS